MDELSRRRQRHQLELQDRALECLRRTGRVDAPEWEDPGLSPELRVLRAIFSDEPEE